MRTPWEVAGMDVDRTWQAVALQRRAVADLLARLDAQQWEHPSLCEGWRVRDVAAHLTVVGVPPSAGSMLVDLARAGGNMHRLNTLVTRRRAVWSPQRLVASLREHADSRNLPVVTDRRNVLFDALVHGQDIAVPLGVDLPVPVEAGVDGADRVWEMGWPFRARRRLEGLRLSATDADWTVGSGAPVQGPIRAMLLLLTGRTAAALPLLRGEGVELLAGGAFVPPRADPAARRRLRRPGAHAAEDSRRRDTAGLDGPAAARSDG